MFAQYGSDVAEQVVAYQKLYGGLSRHALVVNELIDHAAFVLLRNLLVAL